MGTIQGVEIDNGERYHVYLPYRIIGNDVAIVNYKGDTRRVHRATATSHRREIPQPALRNDFFFDLLDGVRYVNTRGIWVRPLPMLRTIKWEAAVEAIKDVFAAADHGYMVVA